MIIQLVALPDTIRSIYNGPMPKRMRKLHPDVAKSFLAMERALGGLVYSDMYRSAEASLAARQKKSGVQRPSFSAHNYGMAVDIAVDQVLKEKGWAYEELLDKLAALGWHCHRRDRRRGMEDWHFNCLFKGKDNYLDLTTSDASTWSRPVEKLILDCHGSQFKLDAEQIQTALKKLGLYSGEIDGQIGPISKQAIKAFQRAWMLPEQTPADARTQRTLAFVAAVILIDG